MAIGVSCFKHYHGIEDKLVQFTKDNFKTQAYQYFDLRLRSYGAIGASFFKKFINTTLVKIPPELENKIKNSTLIWQYRNAAQKSPDLDNDEYINKVDSYYQLDRNSAYMYEFCCAEKMPANYLECYDGYIAETKETYCIYVDNNKVVFPRFADKYTVKQTYVFDLIPKNDRKRLFKIFKEMAFSEDKAITKRFAVAGIGMLRRWGLAAAIAVYMNCYMTMTDIRDKLKEHEITTLKVHTDSIGFSHKGVLPKWIKSSSALGEFKWEYYDMIIAYKNAGRYKIWDKVGNLITDKGDRTPTLVDLKELAKTNALIELKEDIEYGKKIKRQSVENAPQQAKSRTTSDRQSQGNNAAHNKKPRKNVKSKYTPKG